NKAMEQMAQRYPDDYEVQVVYALTLQASASKTDLTYSNQLQSVAILEKLFEQNPHHPGVSHFIIHAYDFAPLADRGIAAAKRYASIAPAVPHARHMPSHIYSMVGMWEESVASNASALEIQPDYYHAADFSVYAHLQLAQDVKAKALIEKSLATPPRGAARDAGGAAAGGRPARGGPEGIRDRVAADAQLLPRLLGSRARLRCGRQSGAGLRVFRQGGKSRQERRYRAAGGSRGQGIPGAVTIAS